MALSKTEAIILKSQKQGETTKILTLYTKAFGKIKAIAKGARTTKSRFLGSLEPLNHVSVVFYRKENRELQFLSQADILHPFLRIRSELGRTSLAMMACEWVNRAEMGESGNSPMFELLLETLEGLDQAEKGLKNVLRSFEFHSLDLHGFRPQLSHCSSCQSAEIKEPMSFDLSSGSYVCEACDSGRGMLMTGSALKLLRWLDRVRPMVACNVVVSAEVGREVDELLFQFGRHHLESLGNLKVPEVIAEIEAGLRGQESSSTSLSPNGI